MTEIDTARHAVKGYDVLDTYTVRLELYRLLCHFLASPRLSAHVDDVAWCPFGAIVDDFEESEVQRLLLSIAVRMRLHIQRFKRDTKAKATLYPVVGTLCNVDKRRLAPLTIKDACDKIIHAQLINFDRKQASKGRRAYLTPKLHLYGIHRDAKWKATVNIVDFVEHAYGICMGYG